MDEQPPPPRSDGPSDPPGRASRAVRAGGRAARSVGRASTGTVRQARRFTQAKGAGESGLSRLLEMHAFNTAGDAAVAVSLAGTLFFTVPTGEARGQVAQFLLLTMLPFAIVAPVIGPFLDRFRRGRRWSIGTTMAVRAFCCWVMSTAVQDGSYALFPAALGCLVASKAYGVTRAAAVPRVLPRSFTLVKANSRISLTGTIGAAVSAPLAVGAAAIGAEWALRYAFVLFVVATVLAVLLPSRVDSSAGEEPVAMSSLRGDSDTRRRLGITFAVVHGLRCNTGLRFLSGFLTMFMAFVLRESPFPGWQPTVLMGLVIGAAGVGNTAGVLLGSVMRSRRPETTVLVVLAVDAALVTLAAVVWALPTAVLLGLTVGVCQSLGKLSLDALIQRDVPEAVRTSVFARSETLLQLAWVVGGFLGLGIGLQTPQLGLGITAAILVVWFVLVAKGSLGRIDADAPRRVS